MMALAYPKLKADAREELACDHFTNALDDPDFALKVKERTPRTLDEALRISLRLEAWAKNVKQEKREEDRTERSKNKVRITAKPKTTKASQHTESNDRLNKFETQMTQIHHELKKLTATHKVSTTPNRPQPQLSTPSFQRSETQATASAEETSAFQTSRPTNRNPRPEFQQPPLNVRQLPLRWECGLPGHISRFCPSAAQLRRLRFDLYMCYRIILALSVFVYLISFSLTAHPRLEVILTNCRNSVATVVFEPCSLATALLSEWISLPVDHDDFSSFSSFKWTVDHIDHFCCIAVNDNDFSYCIFFFWIIVSVAL